MSKDNKDNKKSHARAPGMTQISISLPTRLVDKVDRLANVERRSRSNFIACLLDAIDEGEEGVYLEAAEPKKEFKS